MKLLDNKTNSHWLKRYKNGQKLTSQDAEAKLLSRNDEMKSLHALLLAANEEIKVGQIGTSTTYLVEMMKDPRTAALIGQLVDNDPELQTIIDSIDALVGFQKKGGCAKKKKIRKGAKGCKPCKQLMKIGGKLVNVLTDCEGNIISKHQAGGWLVPKGEDGLEARQKVLLDTKHNADWLKQLTGYTRQLAGPLYYKDDTTGNIYTRTAFLNTDGTYGWNDWSQISELPTNAVTGKKEDLEKINAYTDTYGVKLQYYDGTGWKNAESYYDNNSKSVKWKILGDATHTDFSQDDAVAGANWGAGTISETDATAAGIDASKFATAALYVHGVSGTAGNSLYGTLASGPTAQLYISHYGGWLNAMQAEDDILKAKRRAAYENARLSRLNMRRQMRALDGTATLTINGESKQFTSRAAARKAIRQDRRSYMDEARQARATNQAAILSTLAPQRTTVPSANLTVSTGTATTPNNSTTELRPANQTLTLRFGGRLSQFKTGGYIQKYGLGDLLNPTNPYPNASLNGNFIRDIIAAAKNNKLESAPAVEQEVVVDKNTKPSSNIRAFTFYSKLGRDKVKEIQTNLKKLGYDVEVNGLINDRLVNAVKAFLQSTGATVDGMAGTTTLGKIAEAINWKKPESVDLTTKVNPQWAALPSGVQSDTFDPSKGMISDSRTVDGFTEYLVGDVWVDADSLTSDQINKYKKGLGSLGSKKEVTTKKETTKPSGKSLATPQLSVLYTPQEFMPAWTAYNKNGGWLNKFK